MATYTELRTLFGEDALRYKVRVAVIIAAQAQLVANPGSPAGRAWALAVIDNPAEWGDKVLLTVLAANKAATVAQITGATDAAIQTAVDAVVGSLIAAGAGT